MQVGFSTLPHENTGNTREAAIIHKADLFVLVVVKRLSRNMNSLGLVASQHGLDFYLTASFIQLYNPPQKRSRRYFDSVRGTYKLYNKANASCSREFSLGLIFFYIEV